MSYISEFHQATLRGTFAHYNLARSMNSGFQVEQYLSRTGFSELGRRTNAVAWALIDESAIIRISEDEMGSREFYRMAQAHKDNPYLPLVFKESGLPSGDHITCVEKLISLTNKGTIARYRSIYQADQMSLPVSEEDSDWRTKIDACFRLSTAISKAFLNPGKKVDISSFPNPDAFQEAAVRIFDLAEQTHAQDNRFVPNPDMNRSNILFNENADGSLQPVFNDPLIRQLHSRDEVNLANEKRAQLGMRALAL